MDQENNRNQISFETKIIGWTGTFLIILAYTLNSLQYLPSDNFIYPLLNLIGALLLGWRVWKDRNWSNLFLEFFWSIVAIIALIRLFYF